MVGKGKGEEVAARAGRVFTDAAPLLLGSADIQKPCIQANSGCEALLLSSHDERVPRLRP